MRKIVWIFPIAMLIFSCSSDGGVKTDSRIEVREGEQRSKLSSGSQSEEEIKLAAEKRKKEDEAKEAEKLANQTTMEISPRDYDFGNIAKEKPVTAIFKIKNTGEKPLIIQDASASCGCTVPRKPEEPIMPGEEEELEVTFTSNQGQAGTTVNKTVTVVANIPGSSQVVNIKAKVAS